MKEKKFVLYSELAYVLSVVIIALAVAMASAADFGLSMIVAPAYILSQWLGVISFGQAEYVVQGILFVILCIALRGFKPIYLAAFGTGIFYGAVLDLWRTLVPLLNPLVTPPESLGLGLRITLFVLAEVLTGVSIALCYKAYIYPQVYDFFVSAITTRYGISTVRFKRGFDLGMFLLAVGMSLLLFRGFVGVGIGTLILAVCNSAVIGVFLRLYDKYVDFPPRFPKLAEKFRL